jgi:hypothetical protein
MVTVSDKFRTTKQAWHEDPANHGNGEIPPTASQEILPGPGQEWDCKDCRANPHRSLAVRGFPQADQEKAGRPLLVLSWRPEDDEVSCARPLPGGQIQGSARGGREGKDPGSIRVLLSNPRWERRLLRFLELSGVGRVMDDGADEEETRATRLDGWIPWRVEEWVAPRAPD